MKFLDILLIIISSAGLLHGLAFAVYLLFFKKKKALSNHCLAFMLLFMGLRIGKSVMLNFGNDLEPLFIFAGLAFLLLIGPLLRWYVAAMTQVDFKLPQYYFFELFPFALMFVASFFVTRSWFDTHSKEVIIVFGSALIFIYLHFAFYIIISSSQLKKVTNAYAQEEQTKSQKAILLWLKLLIIGFVVLWISYFLNVIDDTVPYVIGPILYSIVVYFLSYKVYQLKVLDADGNAFKKNDNLQLFMAISKLIEKDTLYLEPSVSLSTISKMVNKTTQKTSEVINQYSNQNFNDFINQYRIEAAKVMLLNNTTHTISAIAFDAGFNSLSSFNSAFKKFEGMTPSVFRKG